MSEKIVAYMRLLTIDVQARTEFRNDPNGSMTTFGLTIEEQTIVTGGPAAIRAAVAAHDPEAAKALKITT